MNNSDHLTDEEAIAEAKEKAPARESLLKTSVLSRGRSLGSLTIRPLTAETLSYLFEVDNFFIKGVKGERVAPSNANAIWSTAEFIYIHSADPDEVADKVWDKQQFKQAVRSCLAGPLNDPQILTAALPIIEQMVAEYFAAQTESVQEAGKGTPIKSGKESARRGKRVTSR